MPRIVSYDTSKYPLKEIVGNHLQVKDLSTLHYDCPLLSREKDQSTSWHKKFYQIGQEYFDCYRQLLKEVIKPLYNDKEIVFQKIPTFRVHLQGNVAVGEFHRDRDYNHGKNEVNYWLPFTDTWDTNTIWIESSEGSKDYSPWPVKYGEILEFDGANLEHGNKSNTTGKTRVSIDFRVVPREHFMPTVKTSINMHTIFDIGGYFDVI